MAGEMSSSSAAAIAARWMDFIVFPLLSDAIAACFVMQIAL
jgi:hypothetical protein